MALSLRKHLALRSKLGPLGGLLGGALPWGPTLSALRTQIAAAIAAPMPHQASVMSSPPTIADLGTSRPSGYTADTTVIGAPSTFVTNGGAQFLQSSTYWRFPVATVTTTGSGGNSGNGKNSIGWRSYADVTSAKFAALISATGSPSGYRFIVNGQYASLSVLSTVATTGATDWGGLDFTSVGGSAKRQIVVEGQLNDGFRGFSGQSGDTTTVPTGKLSPGPNSLKVIYAGDSFTAGTGAMQNGLTSTCDGYAFVLGDYLGAENVWASGAGGTGYVATNTGSSYNLPNRLSDINGMSADIIFSAVGINDIGQSAATIQVNAATCLASFRLNNPRAPIFVIGPFDTAAPSAPVANYSATKAAIQAGMVGISGCWFIDMEGVAYTKFDSTHPNTAGHATIAAYIYGRVKLILGL